MMTIYEKAHGRGRIIMSKQDAVSKFIDYHTALDKLQKEYPGYRDHRSRGELYAVAILKRYLSGLAEVWKEVMDEIHPNFWQKGTLKDSFNFAECPLIYASSGFTYYELNGEDLTFPTNIQCEYAPETQMFKFRFQLQDEHLVSISKTEFLKAINDPQYVKHCLKELKKNVLEKYREETLIQETGPEIDR